MPTIFEKQWASKANVVLDNASGLERASDFGFRVVRALTGGLFALPTGAAWTVHGSSDGVAFGMDGVNRWTSAAVLAAKPPGSGTGPWIVLKHTKADGPTFYLMIKWRNSTNHVWDFRYSITAPVGGGATTFPAEAADSFGATSNLVSTVQAGIPIRVHFSIADDGSFNIMANEQTRGTFSTYIGFHRLVETWPADAHPAVAFDASTSGTTATLATTTALASAANARHLTGEAATAFTGAIRFDSMNNSPLDFMDDAQSGVYPDAHIYVATRVSSNSLRKSVKGRVQDVRFSPNPAHGTCEPSSAAPRSVSVGCLWVPMSEAPDMM